jgi:flagellar biosynthesis protein FlhF
MRVQRFLGESFLEAVASAKQVLGADAVVLQSRTCRKGGFLGIAGRRLWQVTAVAAGEFASESGFDDSAPESYAHRPSRGAEAPADMKQPIALEDAFYNRQGKWVLDELAEIRRMLQTNQAEVGDWPRRPSRHRLLLDSHLPGPLVRRLVEACEGLPDWQSPLAREEALAALLEREIPVASAEQLRSGRIVALVGVTGVGKTTTIAKLAALARIRDHRRVGLVTMDTYRIAAVDQLRTYADIIDLPMQVALTPGEMAQAVHQYRDMDLILIDTAGRSQRDQASLEQVAGFLDAAKTDQRHLVIPATFGGSQVREVARRFATLSPTHVIVSKSDEAVRLGQTLEAALLSKVGLSYLTTGQDVPNDLTEAHGARLARRIVAEIAGEDRFEHDD